MQGLDRLFTVLERGAGILARLLVVAIIAILVAQIFCRFVLNRSLIWSEEVATWCMVWVVYLGSAVLMRHAEHVKIPIFVRLLPFAWRVPAIIIARAATLVCVLFVTWYGVVLVTSGFHLTSQTTGINTRWIKLCIPIGMGMMSLFAFGSLLQDLRRLARRDLAHFEDYGLLPGETDQPSGTQL